MAGKSQPDRLSKGEAFKTGKSHITHGSNYSGGGQLNFHYTYVVVVCRLFVKHREKAMWLPNRGRMIDSLEPISELLKVVNDL